MATTDYKRHALREAEVSRAFRVMLPTILLATFMAQFDFFVVNVAAPTMQAELHSSSAGLELVVGGYAFAYAAGLVLGGRLGDLFGYRRMFVTGMAGFGLASALCALAATTLELVSARLAQGLAAALMLLQVLAIISRTFTDADRPKAMSLFGVAAGTGAIAGQVLGGLLVSENVLGLSWRLIFWVNVPIAIVGVIVAHRVLPSVTGTERHASLDLLGAAGLAMTLVLVLMPMTLGRSMGWPWWTWLSLAAAPVILVATLRRERALVDVGGAPVIDLRLFRRKSFRLGVVANAAFMSFFASYMFTLALVLQKGLSLSPFTAGLVFAPAGVGFSVTALTAPWLVARWGRRALAVSSVVVVAGLAGITVFASTGTLTVADITISAMFVSVGNGVLLPSLVGAAMQDVPASVAGAASGALSTAQQFAGAAGVTLIGTVYFDIAERAGTYITAMAAAAGLCALLMMLVGVLATRST